MGSFRLNKTKKYLHFNNNFTKQTNMTANASLSDSCGTVFIRQEISLHFDPQNKTAIYLTIETQR